MTDVSTITKSLTTLRSPPTTVDQRIVVYSALALTVLLVVSVPVITFVSSLPLLVVVIAAGGIYGAGLIYTNSVFEGLCAAVLVLCTFAGNLPLAAQQPMAGASIQLNLLLVDFVAAPLAALLIVWNGGIRISFDRQLNMVVGYGLVGVLVWSLLSAVVSNGPSQFGAMVFVTTHIRYLLLFSVGVAIIRYIGFRTVINSLLIVLGGHIAYAIAEVLNGGSFGLSYLGDAAGITIDHFLIGPFSFASSMYAGGFVGNSRGLTMLIILLLPLLIERIVRGSVVQRLLAAIYAVGAVFIIRASGSDASLGAFLLVVIAIVAVLTYLVLTTDAITTASNRIGYIYAYACTIGVGLLTFVLYSGRGIAARERESGRNNGGGEGDVTGGATGGNTAANRPETQSISERAADILGAIPLVDTANLSIRFKQYAAAIEIGLTYPLFGLGGRNFLFVAESYGMPFAVSIHNLYFFYLAAIGIPGALLLVATLVAVLLAAVVEATQAGRSQLRWGLLACGIFGFYAYGFWTSGHMADPTFMTFWLLAGAMVGAREASERVGQHTQTTSAT
ncbi:hypothetical protein [Halococcus sp. AFM35]|uniref:hypothetical protein n=1 Tax=Halococcus sp. AFM35 TaxID=3421653 RepID=UPI003EB8D5A5